MKLRISKSIIGTIVFFLLNSNFNFGQTVTINAGSNQIINWEKTHSAQLNGSVSSDKIKLEWSCPQNSEVIFKDASNPVTEVTFPRSGYYLLILSGKESSHNSVIINVFKPNSYKERLSDLISLMTVDEKIKQLTNQSDSIPRLGIPKYNYWSEALHGVLSKRGNIIPASCCDGSYLGTGTYSPCCFGNI